MTASNVRVLVPLAPGFEEIEAVTIVDVLRRAGLTVVTASLGDVAVTGAHDMVIQADTTLGAALKSSEAADAAFDAVVLPGGMPGSAHLRDDPRVLAALRDVVSRDGLAAAVCAAPIALQAAGLLDGRTATAYPSFLDQLVDATTSEERVVEDGPILTGAGPGAALEFALAVVGRLVSAECAEALADGMLLKR